MKLIIDIDENLYNRIQTTKSAPDLCGTDIVNAITRIQNGKVLSNNHGDLIDRDVACDEFDKACLSWSSGLLKYIPTVIPADKKGSAE